MEWYLYVFWEERVHSFDNSQWQLKGLCNFWRLRDCTSTEIHPLDDIASRWLASKLAAGNPLAALSSLRLDCKDFCTVRAPFVVGHCLPNLTDLEISSQKEGFVCFPASLHLARLVVRAVFVDPIVPDLAAFAAGIEHLYLC